MFRDRGYAASSMRDLAALLGIEAASLYSHIRSKEQILQNIVFKMASAFIEAVEATEGAEPALQLTAAIKAHFRVIARNLDASAVFFNEWRHLSEPHLAKFLALRDQYEQFYFQIINKGINSGVFKPMNEKLVIRTMLSSINGTHRWYRKDGELSEDQIADQLSELLIHGITNPGKK